ADGRLIHGLEAHGGAAHCVTYAAGGRQIASGGYDGFVRLWDASSGRLLRSLAGNGGPVNHLVCSPDGRRLAYVLGSGLTAHLWDLEAGREVPGPEGLGGKSSLVAFSPDGRSLAWNPSGMVAICDAATGEERHRWRPPRPALRYAHTLLFSPDGKALL